MGWLTLLTHLKIAKSNAKPYQTVHGSFGTDLEVITDPHMTTHVGWRARKKSFLLILDVLVAHSTARAL